jgi:outer membrane lipopolysaccharide assembly protein LptE/RlpB
VRKSGPSRKMLRINEWPLAKIAQGERVALRSSGQASGEKEKQKRGRAKAPPYNNSTFLTKNLELKAWDFARVAKASLILAAFMMVSGCGYHVAGKNDALPKSIHVIAVPALENKTSVYRIEQRLTAATVHEFLAKTPYRVVPEPANADAVLRGKVLSLEAVPLLFDTATGRATTMLVTVKCEITFEERETGKILYHSENFLFRNQYEIANILNPKTSAVDPTTVTGFFQEQDPALDRLAQDFAARLVAAVTENF